MAEKLFYADAHLRKFTARVLSCEESGRLFAVTLDRTAFFPEGGGQSGDIGTLGGARVTDTREERGEILHFCDAPLVPGAEVTGELDWETRFARMQIHSAEHLVSGHAHALWGCGNVGFHMDEHGATIDFDRELDAPQLMRLERLVNEDVWKNLPINILWPAEEELAAMPFRQKKELSMPVRIVEVPGVDLCACCAPHVSFTGEIGLVRLKDRMRHRGGVRFTMLAGRAAYEDAALCAAETESLSRLFSAPQNALCAAAERLLGELEEEKYARAAAERRYVEARLAARKPCEGNLLFFEDGLSPAALRALAEGGKTRCTGVCAALCAEDGGYRYVMASETTDLRAAARSINAALSGRGGGAPGMIQGSLRASRETVERYFHGKIG